MNRHYALSGTLARDPLPVPRIEIDDTSTRFVTAPRTRSERQARATRPDLWPKFQAPPEEVPAVDDLDLDGEWLASVDPDDLDSMIDAHMARP